jgi:hypothetical protein
MLLACLAALLAASPPRASPAAAAKRQPQHRLQLRRQESRVAKVTDSCWHQHISCVFSCLHLCPDAVCPSLPSETRGAAHCACCAGPGKEFLSCFCRRCSHSASKGLASSVSGSEQSSARNRGSSASPFRVELSACSINYHLARSSPARACAVEGSGSVRCECTLPRRRRHCGRRSCSRCRTGELSARAWSGTRSPAKCHQGAGACAAHTASTPLAAHRGAPR